MSPLMVVGTGIKSLAHLSQETIIVIKQSAKVLYLVNEPLMKEWINRECQNCESLDDIYFTYEKRIDAYQAITDYIISENKKCLSLCVIFYGHPVIFASSALRAVQYIKKNHQAAVILPAISSIDCLFADLAIDPGETGYYSVDATDFLIYKKKFDTGSHLILWQVGNLGTFNQEKTFCIEILQNYLFNFFPKEHQVCLYEASQYPGGRPRIDFFHLSKLSLQAVNSISTLFIPAIDQREVDFEMLKKLKMTISNFQRSSSLLVKTDLMP